MTNEVTGRFGLPLLVPGQAQKEMTHNEALALIDLALHAQVIAIGVDIPPADPSPGDCWTVGDSPTGAWAGQARHIAGWTDGGWRFLRPKPGMSVFVSGTGTQAVYRGGTWVSAAAASAISTPVGGEVIDSEARSAVAAILTVLRERDWVCGGT